mgnify:CR=1 FL=1
MLRKIPERITFPDRNWFALAGYNVGFGHLEDARILAQKQEMTADTWQSVKLSLPLLRQKKWYSQTRFGYARGYEPVRYVGNIRQYYAVLVQLFNLDGSSKEVLEESTDRPIEGATAAEDSSIGSNSEDVDGNKIDSGSVLNKQTEQGKESNESEKEKAEIKKQ